MADIHGLFDEYARAYARGEAPRAREYLERAGPAADELAGLIDGFLASAPAAPPDEAARARIAALAPEGLADLRTRRGLGVDEVVDALIKRLGLEPAKRAKAKAYYEQLERGLLDRARVSKRVFAELGAVLGGDAWTYAGRAAPKPKLLARFRMSEAAPAAMPPRAAAPPRAAGAAPPTPAFGPSAAERAAPEEDEVDRLFTRSDA